MRPGILRAFGVLVIGSILLAGCSKDPRDPYRLGYDRGYDRTGATDRPYSGYDPDRARHGPQRELAATSGDTVYFETDSSALTYEARRTLDAQADWLRRRPTFSVTIEGHADERGTREYNLGLGARRAAAVRAYLIDKGIAPGRIDTISYGKERPIALCGAPRCWDRNRRAVTVLGHFTS